MSENTKLSDFGTNAFFMYLVSLRANANYKPISIRKTLRQFYQEPQFKHLHDEIKDKFHSIFGNFVNINVIEVSVYPKNYGCWNVRLYSDKSICDNFDCNVHPDNESGSRKCNSRRRDAATIWFKKDELDKTYLINDNPVMIRNQLIKEPIPILPFLSKLYNISVEQIDEVLMFKFIEDFNLSINHLRLYFNLDDLFRNKIDEGWIPLCGIENNEIHVYSKRQNFAAINHLNNNERLTKIISDQPGEKMSIVTSITYWDDGVAELEIIGLFTNHENAFSLRNRLDKQNTNTNRYYGIRSGKILDDVFDNLV